MLNKQLYDALHRAFGPVKVYSIGEAVTYSVKRRTALDKSGKDWAENVKGGEHYAVRCPFCGRPTLWFSYVAGSYMEPKGQSPIWFPRGLLICYHCHETDKKEKRDEIWKKLQTPGQWFRVEETAGDKFAALDSGLPAEPVNAGISTFPSGCGIASPAVPEKVKKYLIERNVDPVELQKECAACWCENPTGDGVGRIVFPVYKNGKVVGWQGRALPEDVEKGKPKYWTFGSKANWLFNMDRARWFPFGVLVEGVFDCFRVGVQGVCRFGKTTSIAQLRMLRSFWGNQSVIVLPDMNDPAAWGDAEKEVTEWNARGLFKDGALMVRLPEGRDPGSMSHQEIANLIKEQTGKELA